MKKLKDTSLTMKITSELKEQLQTVAEDKETSVSSIVTLAIKRYLASLEADIDE